MKRNLYFCQFSDALDDNIYLPYSIGIIVSHLRNNAEFQNDRFNLIFIKQDVEAIVGSLFFPDYLFLSVYMWNFNYSIDVAKAVKEKFPNCKIVLGGHQVPFDSSDFFDKFPFVDILVHGEGEFVCEEILKETCLFSINNITFNKDGHAYKTRLKFSDRDINEIPSPYLTGVFDEIIKLPYKFTASLETNRGCPFACAYCDWGNCKTSPKKLRFFNDYRILQEIEWFGQNKIEFVFGCDSNFGIVKNDLNFVNKIIYSKLKYGFPKKFRVCYTKNSDDFVLELNYRLNKHGLSKGATLSLQSLNNESLKAVNRVNINISKFASLLKEYNKRDIPTYTEMILGLPMETEDSFKNGLSKLLELEQHSSIVVYICQVYPNSELNSDSFRKNYGLITKKVPMYAEHVLLDDTNIEIQEVIVGSETMDSISHIRSCMFSWVVQTFHCLGITQLAAIYMYKKHKIKYRDIYEILLSYMEKNPYSVIGQEYYKILNKYRGLHNGYGLHYKLSDTENFNWTLEEGSFLNLIKKKDILYQELNSFFLDVFPGIATVDILDVNKIMLRDFANNEKFLELNNQHLKILKTLNISHATTDSLTIRPNLVFNTFKQYANGIIWYGRKGGKFFYEKEEII